MTVFGIIWWLSIGLSALSVTVLVFLYLRRLIINKRLAGHATKRAQIQEFIYGALSGGDEASRKFSPEEQRILLGVATEMMRGVAGPMKEQIVRILVNNVDQERLAKGLKDKMPEDRAKAAARLFWATSPVVHAALRDALNDTNPHVVLAAINSLISAGQKLSLVDILPKLESRGMLGHRAVRDIFRRLASENGATLAVLMEDPDPAVVVLAVDAVARVPSPFAMQRIALLAKNHPSVDVRATAIRSIGLVADKSYESSVIDALSDSAWQVKGQAAIAVGRLRITDAIPHLSEMVRDTNWWVQLRSAQALARLGDNGLRVLEELRGDAAQAALAEFALAERHL